MIARLADERGGFGHLIPPVAPQPAAPGGLAPIAPRPAAVRQEILQRRELERDAVATNGDQAAATRQQRDGADLQQESAKPDQVEHTPAPEIDPHIEICVKPAKIGSSPHR